MVRSFFTLIGTILLTIVIAFNNGCTNDEINYFDKSEVSVLKNGKTWGYIGVTAYKPNSMNHTILNVSIVVGEYFGNSSGALYEALDFYNIPSDIGRSELLKSPSGSNSSISSASYATYLELGHVIGDQYILLEGLFDNYFEVIDVTHGILEAKFQVALLKDPDIVPHDASAPDTVLFTNGYLMCSIQE